MIAVLEKREDRGPSVAHFPVSPAEVPRPFYIGKFEVTQDRYQKVMGKNPSAWGIHDMLGNVWEWAEDRHDYQIVPSGPTGPASGKEHVLKGGGFQSYQRMARVAAHAGGPGTIVSLGFRILREAR